MRIVTGILAVTLLAGWETTTVAGGKRHRPATTAPPRQMVTPNGSVVPAWAARRIENSTVPLYAPTYGRRPWANALAMANTPSSRWAAASQLGFGAGPVPGFTNGPPLGNYPQAAVGPSDTVVPPRRDPFLGFPFNLYGGGLSFGRNF